MDAALIGMCVGERKEVVLVHQRYSYSTVFFYKEPLRVTLTLRAIDTEPYVRDDRYEQSSLPDRYWKDDVDAPTTLATTGILSRTRIHVYSSGVGPLQRKVYHVLKGGNVTLQSSPTSKDGASLYVLSLRCGPVPERGRTG